MKNTLNEVSIIPPLDKMPSKINHPFGEKRTDEIHPGVDLGVKTGSLVRAIMDGEVVNAMCCVRKCGATIDIDYKNGFWSRYCHMSRIDVKKGDIVKQGQVVGLSGGKPGSWGAGNSKGEHLHFTLKKDGKLVDPMNYINKAVEGGEFEKTSTSELENVVSQLKDKDSVLANKEGTITLDDLKKMFPGDILKKAFTKSLFPMTEEKEKKLLENIQRIKKLLK